VVDTVALDDVAVVVNVLDDVGFNNDDDVTLVDDDVVGGIGRDDSLGSSVVVVTEDGTFSGSVPIIRRRCAFIPISRVAGANNMAFPSLV
jgi:hypothetical protein